MTRRELLLGAAGAFAAPAANFKKGICGVVFAPGRPLSGCMAEARDAGFEAIELVLGRHIAGDAAPGEWSRVRELAEKSRLIISCLWPPAELAANPLNDPDEARRARGAAILRSTVEAAQGIGCDTVLLVPGRVQWDSRRIGYEDTWNRCSAGIRKAVQTAVRCGVVIAVENVLNRFLLSPLEMRQFIDQFQSPAVGALLDAGNAMRYGYPQDWILTLKNYIRRVHVKGYKFLNREGGQVVGLHEGDVNWKEVLTLLSQVGYRGAISAEFPYDSSEPGQLLRISRDMDRLLKL